MGIDLRLLPCEHWSESDGRTGVTVQCGSDDGREFAQLVAREACKEAA